MQKRLGSKMLVSHYELTMLISTLNDLTRK